MCCNFITFSFIEGSCRRIYLHKHVYLEILYAMPLRSWGGGICGIVRHIATDSCDSNVAEPSLVALSTRQDSLLFDLLRCRLFHPDIIVFEIGSVQSLQKSTNSGGRQDFPHFVLVHREIRVALISASAPGASSQVPHPLQEC